MDNAVENIKTEILALFWKYGIKSVTMDDISQHLGISKKTLYKHFKDKRDLVYQITEMQFKTEEILVKEIEENSIDPVDHLVKVSNCMRQYAKQINPTAVLDIRKHYPKSWQLINKHKQLVVAEQFKRNLIKGIEQGLYRKEINVEVMTQLKLAEFDLVFDNQSFEIEGLNLMDISIELFDHFLRGIFTEKGLEKYINYTSQANN